MSVFTDFGNRGVRDLFFLVCDGLKGLPEVVGNVWPLTTVQTCIIHLIRGSFRLASKKYWDELKRDLKPIYTAPSPDAARDAFESLKEKWGARYPAIIRLWVNAWEEFISFPGVDARNQESDVLHECDLQPERPLPKGREITRAFSQPWVQH
jgi:putative transposase